MSERTREDRGANRIVAILLFVLAGILLATAAAGFILQGTEQNRENLSRMRTSAVLHAASEGLIDNIAQEARAEKLKELRADKNFRKRGLDEVNAICDGAMNEARAEAEKLYSNPTVQDESALRQAIDAMQESLGIANKQTESERAVYSDLYQQLMESVVSWKTVAPEGSEDSQVTAELIRLCADLDKEENRHLQTGFLRLARDLAAKETEQERKEERDQLMNLMTGAIADWTEYSGLADEELWDRMTKDAPELAQHEAFREELVTAAKSCVEAAEKGEALPTLTSPAKDGDDTLSDTVTDYAYFTPTEKLETELAAKDADYEALYAQLVTVIPDLSTLNKKLQDTLRGNIENVISHGGEDFATVYGAYAEHKGDAAVTDGAFGMKLASIAKQLLLGGIALLLLGLVLFFWKRLTKAYGVPRTIITLFFIYLCLLAEVYHISVTMMLGNVLERMTMYGVLVLAMMPGIQCGIGLNMGMTIGCIAGLLGIVLALQWNMIGFVALIVACLLGVVIATPLGWSYSKLLNRMKGNEMTISTYVGFSFVSLMCIGWMLLPFNNPKIIWLLSGRGLRVTHSLLGSFAHLLDNALSFRVFGIKIPTGGLLFLGVCCLMMWLFSRSKTGIAMTAVGSNPRFAEASGISVNRMRTIGTVLSTIIAAVGIVIYSQAFGYAQLYTAPRQLGFIASSAILIGGATVSKAKVSHVLIGVFLFEGVLVFGQQIANSVVAGGGLSEVMRIMISNGIILYALTQTGGGRRE